MMIFRLFYLEELCSRGNLSIVFWFERGAVVRDVPEHPVDFRAMSSIHKILRAVGGETRVTMRTGRLKYLYVLSSKRREVFGKI